MGSSSQVAAIAGPAGAWGRALVSRWRALPGHLPATIFLAGSVAAAAIALGACDGRACASDAARNLAWTGSIYWLLTSLLVLGAARAEARRASDGVAGDATKAVSETGLTPFTWKVAVLGTAAHLGLLALALAAGVRPCVGCWIVASCALGGTTLLIWSRAAEAIPKIAGVIVAGVLVGGAAGAGAGIVSSTPSTEPAAIRTEGGSPAEAHAENVLVIFEKPGCPACEEFRAEVIPKLRNHPAVTRIYQVNVDTVEGESYRQRWGVSLFPTTLWFQDSIYRDRFEGFVPAEALLGRLPAGGAGSTESP